ncbi:MAG: hypothetical protein EP343_06345 [Deltaproteobacteria bacterium]|nr:MAG: hypothetical protein EP343_06345 [Deltaproteobacteria bacterium]
MMQQHKAMLLELKNGKHDVADTPSLAEASLISRELVAAVKESASLCAEPHDVSQTGAQESQPLQEVTYTEIPAWNTTGQVVQRGTEELVPFSEHRHREWVSAQEELALSSKDAHPQAEQPSTFSTHYVALEREEECFSVELDTALAASSDQLLAMNSGEFLAITDEGKSSLQLAGMSLLQGLSSNDTTLIADSVRKLATASEAVGMRSLWWLTPTLETVS